MGGDVRALECRIVEVVEIIDYGDLNPSVEKQPIYQMASNESGSAG
jgi:hypothetical protein